MPYISPEQCRAARALLDWQQRDLVRASKVSKKTVADFERGKTAPQVRTLDDLRQAFEAAGIEFLDDVKGVGGLGVRMRMGFRPVTRMMGADDAARSDDASGLDACGWDDDDGEAPDAATLARMEEALKATAPLVLSEEERRALAEHYRAQPERWAALREISRQALLQAMGLERLG